MLRRFINWLQNIERRREQRKIERIDKQLEKLTRKREKIAKQLGWGEIKQPEKITDKITAPSPNDNKSSKKVIDEKVEEAKHGNDVNYLLGYLEMLYNNANNVLFEEEIKERLKNAYLEIRELISNQIIKNKQELEDKWYTVIREINEMQ